MDAVQPNHIALLRHRAKYSGNTVLLKIPIVTESEVPQTWNTITVADFAAHVDRVANFLLTELNDRDIPPRSPVSLLSDGSQYQDLVYAIALARASYIPHMCPMLTHPAVIYGLMEKAGSKMILYNPSLEHLTADCPFPKMILNAIESSTETSSTVHNDSTLPRIEDLPSSSDIGIIFNTSGSTSGSPKIVPFTHQVLNMMTRAKMWSDGESLDASDIFLGFESAFHLTGVIQYLKCLYVGACFIQPSRRLVSNQELLNLVNLCGLNHIIAYGTHLACHIQSARKDPAIMKLLRGMRSILYSGVGISYADDDWCFQNGIPLISIYGTTECGRLMASIPGKPSRFIRPLLSDKSYWFDLVKDTTEVDAASTQLFEFVLLADSPQIPQSCFLSTDGNYHPGDLFEKHPDESYVLRGRNDDWIKNANADSADAKAIQDKIHETCSDLVKECIVVGTLRRSPALFVEVHSGKLTAISEDSLKELIIQRMEDFNARQYEHEQIKDRRLIFLADEGVLPRTRKGNFSRKEIEQKYAKELDAMYISVYGSSFS